MADASTYKTAISTKSKGNWTTITSNTDAMIDEAMLRMELLNARKSKGMTQKELSSLCGLSESCISNIENPDGKSSPTLRSLAAYAAALGIEIYINFTPHKENKDEKDNVQ